MDAFDDKSLRPMLIGKTADPFDDDEYLFELKLDGVRCLAYLDETGTVLLNRRGGKLLPKMPELENLHKQVKQKCILDGELISATGGGLDFEEIKQRALMSNKARIDRLSRKTPATFVAFDILYSEDRLVTDERLFNRKMLLEDSVMENERISISRYIEGRGTEFFELVKKQGLEGIIAKKKSGRYYPGRRTADWMKIKNLRDDDFVVCGYVQNSDRIISAILGQYDENGELLYMGHASLSDSREDFAIIKKQKKAGGPPFGMKLPTGNENAVWLELRLVCTVEFLNRTASGMIRQPIFKGLRADKTPKEAGYRA